MTRQELNFFAKVRIYAVKDALEWNKLKASIISAIEEDTSGVRNVRFDSIGGGCRKGNAHEKRIIDMSERVERIEQMPITKKAEETVRWYKEQLCNLPCEAWMKLLIDKIWKEKGKGNRKTVVMEHKVLEETAKERGIGETKLREMIIKTMEKGEIDKEGYKGFAASEKESIERLMIFDEYRELYGIPKNNFS